ncbi:aspartate 1-decarboxylase [Alicyclobacillus tolerans]|uniref:aspartate 1-decarboxylase n=1 Tax=Alicyclobacillus tolerans TaxID=90970 RepID=UPI001EFF913A|nr:aspartate 1-decarboxylase [Alicyclobacillus tolerans]MCF8568047.1 aspartate 1-decarboxylase [Alicyclobacillus tolerans]
MLRTLMKSKLHRVRVTGTNLHYVGSITIDEELMEKAQLLENELVQIVNINTGSRFDTYVIRGPRDSGAIELNGAAARLAEPGDLVIVMSYGIYDAEEVTQHQPKVIVVDEKNRVLDFVDSEAKENARYSCE